MASKAKRKTSTARRPLVGVVMGSDSDWPTLKVATEILQKFGVPF